MTDSPLDADDNYQLVLAVERVLMQQETRARDDLKRLMRLRAEALADPESYVRRLVEGTVERAPSHQAVPTVPVLDLRTYIGPSAGRRLRSHTSTASAILGPGIAGPANDEDTVSLSTVMGDLANRRRQKPLLAPSEDASPVPTPPAAPLSPSTTGVATPGAPMDRGPSSASRKPSAASDSEGDASSHETMRSARRAHMSRSDARKVKIEPGMSTFGMSWTDEEQRRFEELLLIYPHENVLAQRCAKISRAMGTRTPQQVASHLQKHFIRLAKQGKPIPGVMTYDFKNYKRNKPIGARRPTPAHEKKQRRPKKLDDDDDDDNDASGTVSSRERPASSIVSSTHIGYQCDQCGMEPIVGTRWTCQDCAEVDLCNQCDRTIFTKGSHTPSHRFERVDQAEAPGGFLDQDYSTLLGEYNYLDPNFNPP